MIRNVGVIGTGVIGKPIALRLVQAGFQVAVHDVRPEPIEALRAAGAVACGSAAEVAGVARTGSRELFTLCVVAAAVGIAYASAALFGVSFALGAFFAGMVLRESEFSQRAAEQTLPLQDAFAVLFFVSVGMLFDPRVLIEQPLAVLATLLIVMVGKTLAAVLLVLILRYPLRTALSVGASLAQIGEFSFITALDLGGGPALDRTQPLGVSGGRGTGALAASATVAAALTAAGRSP